MLLIVLIMMSLGRLRLALKRRDDQRAGKIGAEDGEEEEFALGIHVRALGEVLAQMSFGQKVREEGRHTPRHGAEVYVTSPPVLPLKDRLKARALPVIYISPARTQKAGGRPQGG